MSYTIQKERKTRLITVLNEIGALKFGTFKLTSGKTSAYYIDLRVVPSFPEAFQIVCDCYLDVVTNDVGVDRFDRLSGIPTAGIPFASVIAYQLRKPLLYVRPGVRSHGRGRRIEGVLMPGDRVLLIDDLITTGGSLLTSANVIRTDGGVVRDAVVLLDRSEGGKESLAKNNIALHYLLNVKEIALQLYELGSITREQFKIIVDQAHDRGT